mgnify:CR=1 FL=1
MTATLQINPANYDVYSLAVVIENFMNNSLQDVNNGIIYKVIVDYDTDLQKYKFNFSKIDDAVATDTIRIEMLFGDLVVNDTPHIEMGFIENSTITALLPATIAGGSYTTQIVSQNVVDVNGSIHGVYIRTNLVSDGTLDTQSGTFSNILARVPINVNAGGIIFATPNNATHRAIVDLRTIDTLTIRLTDERNRILDLNGLHFQVALAVDFLYAKRKINIPMGHLRINNYGDSHIDEHPPPPKSKAPPI